MKKITTILAVCTIALVAAQGQALADVGRVTGLNECRNTPHAHAYEIRANFRCGKARELARAYNAKAVRKSKTDIWVRGFRCEFRINTFRVSCHTKRRSAKWQISF